MAIRHYSEIIRKKYLKQDQSIVASELYENTIYDPPLSNKAYIVLPGKGYVSYRQQRVL